MAWKASKANKTKQVIKPANKAGRKAGKIGTPKLENIEPNQFNVETSYGGTRRQSRGKKQGDVFNSPSSRWK